MEASSPGEVEPLVREALRVYRRYQREIVEGFKLCPWAEKAREDGRVRDVVRVDATPDVAGTLATVDAIADDAGTDIGLVLFPRLRVTRPEFERFVSAVREADGARGRDRVRLAMAAFHPEALADTKTADRLVPFLRRTPDPTIQLVRRTILDAVHAQDAAHGSRIVDLANVDLAALLATAPQKAITDRIAEHNLETVTRVGVAEVERAMKAIKADRDASYAALGER